MTTQEINADNSTNFGQELIDGNIDINSTINAGRYKGCPVAFWLAHTTEGTQVIFDNPDIANNISTGTLNHVIQEGEYKGESCVFWLCASSDGLKVLSKYQHLIDTISEASLNHIIKSGNDKGQSAAFWLCST